MVRKINNYEQFMVIHNIIYLPIHSSIMSLVQLPNRIGDWDSAWQSIWLSVRLTGQKAIHFSVKKDIEE